MRTFSFPSFRTFIPFPPLPINISFNLSVGFFRIKTFFYQLFSFINSLLFSAAYLFTCSEKCMIERNQWLSSIIGNKKKFFWKILSFGKVSEKWKISFFAHYIYSRILFWRYFSQIFVGMFRSLLGRDFKTAHEECKCVIISIFINLSHFRRPLAHPLTNTCHWILTLDKSMKKKVFPDVCWVLSCWRVIIIWLFNHKAWICFHHLRFVFISNTQLRHLLQGDPWEMYFTLI